MLPFYRGKIILLQELLQTSSNTNLYSSSTNSMKKNPASFLGLDAARLRRGEDEETAKGTELRRVGGTEKWVRLPEEFLLLPSEQGAHSSKSRSPRWGRRRREGEENTWRTEHGCCCSPTTLSPLLPSLSPLFFLHSASLLLFILTPLSFSSLLLSFLSFKNFFPPTALLLYRRTSHLLHVNSLGNDKRLSNDSPVRDCKTTHSSLNHQALNPKPLINIWSQE